VCHLWRHGAINDTRSCIAMPAPAAAAITGHNHACSTITGIDNDLRLEY
jgi:hypothetical protein